MPLHHCFHTHPGQHALICHQNRKVGKLLVLGHPKHNMMQLHLATSSNITSLLRLLTETLQVLSNVIELETQPVGLVRFVGSQVGPGWQADCGFEMVVFGAGLSWSCWMQAFVWCEPVANIYLSFVIGDKKPSKTLWHDMWLLAPLHPGGMLVLFGCFPGQECLCRLHG